MPRQSGLKDVLYTIPYIFSLVLHFNLNYLLAGNCLHRFFQADKFSKYAVKL